MTARIDRKTALRRAAAPSVDFSLMPNPGAIQALLDAANGTTSEDTPRTRRPLSRNATIVPASEDVDAIEAELAADDYPAEPQTESVVPDRFRMRTRPRNQPTLQPFDVPMARALDDDDVALDAALAFVRTHEQAPRPTRKPSETPTLILELPNASSPTRQPSDTLRPQPIHRATERPSALTLTPQGEDEAGFWDTTPSLETVPELDGQPTLAEEIDPDLDVWMRARGRSRFLSALGVAAAMLMLVAAAAGGVMVMASPAMMSMDAAPSMDAPLPPPPQPRP